MLSSLLNTGDLLTTSGMSLSIMIRFLVLLYFEEVLIYLIDNGKMGLI